MENKGNFPRHLSIQTTSMCNAACIFCPYEEVKSLFPPKIMEERLYQKIIDEAAHHKNVERVILYMNNEPLTDPHLVERINYAKERIPWASVHILTNGSLLTEEMGEKLAHSKLDWIGISLHGIRKDTLSKTMGIDPEVVMGRVLKFLDKAKEHRNLKEFAMITFLGHRYLTTEEKEETVRFWREKGVERISYFDQPISRAGNVKSLSIVGHNEVAGCKSIWATEMMHITETGEVVLCCMDWKREIVLGDLNTQSIEATWSSARYAEARSKRDGKKASEKDFICKRCEEAIVLERPGLVQDRAENKEGDILLVICPPWGVDTPPLGIASLATHLNNHGVVGKVLDLNIGLYHEARNEHKYLWEMGNALHWRDTSLFGELRSLFHKEIAHFAEEILSSGIKLVGFSVLSTSQDRITMEVIRQVKQRQPDTKIILGGISVSVPEQRALFCQEIPDLIEAFVIGEGEETLLELVQRERGGVGWGGLSGVLIPRVGESSYLPRKEKEDLDAFAFPSFDEFKLNDYLNTTEGLIAEWSRGCIGNCLFCAFKTVSGKLRCRSPRQRLAAIQYYANRYKLQHISLVDSAVNGDLHALEETCDLLIKAENKVKISCLAMPRREMRTKLLEKMKRAGFRRIEYGIETGSNKILKRMRKTYSSQEAEETLRVTHEAGLFTAVYLIVGFPGEGDDEFLETMDFLKRNSKYIDLVKSVNPLYLMSGSPLYENRRDYGIFLPESHADMQWSINHENTHPIRLRRVEAVRSLLRDLKVAYFSEDNMFEKTELMNFEKKRQEDVCLNKCPDERNSVGSASNCGMASQDGLAAGAKACEMPERFTKGNAFNGIALIMVPPWWTRMPPLGLAYLDSFLRFHGVETKIVDLNVKFFNKAGANKRHLWDISTINNYTSLQLGELFCGEFSREIETFIDEIAHSKEGMVGLSTTIASINVAVYMAQQIKRKNPSKIIILGGSGVFWNTQSLDPERVVDIFIIGEGELSLLEVVRRFQKTGCLSDLAGIPGTMVRLGKEYHSSPKLNPIKNLDEIPTVDFSGFDLKAYNVHDSCQPLPVLISRGCINRCSFCVDHKMTFPFRVRSPLKVLEDFRFYVQKLGIRDFDLNDLLCNGNLKQLEEICDLLIKEGLGIRWHSYAAIRSGMTPELFKKMKAAGCHRLCYGMESASDEVLKKMNKPYGAEVAEQVIRDTHDAGISTSINVILGHPGESEKEFKQTCEFVRKNKAFIDEITNVSTCFLMPETDLVKDFGKYGIYFRKKTLPCNLRKFCVRPDNTPRSRAVRLRKMVHLINKLKIPHVIVNRAVEDDLDFDDFLKNKNRGTCSSVRDSFLKVDLNPEDSRAGHISFKGQKLTTNVGLNTSFKINGQWSDSSAADWKVKNKDNRLFAEIVFKNLPISQEWSFKVDRESFLWKVATFFHEGVMVDQQKTGIVFSDRYQQYATKRSLADFPASSKLWAEVGLFRSNQAELISKAILPNVNLRWENRWENDAFFHLQNLPASFAARMINFCLCDPGFLQGQVQTGRFFKKNKTTREQFKITLSQK